MSQLARSFCDLPPELLLQVAQHLTFEDHVRWLLTDRRHGHRLSPILYLRLLQPTTDTFFIADEHEDEHSTRITRKDVLRWAIEHGLVSTLNHIDEVEDISIFFNATLTTTVAGIDLTPIHQAALCGHVYVIEYLLQKGADANASTTDGLLPIHFAKTGEVVHLLADRGGLLEHGTNPSAISALTSSISHKCDSSAVTALLQLGADPEHVGPDNRTAAGEAVAQGNAEVLRILLDSGINANQLISEGNPLIYTAIWLGARDHGVDVAKTMAAMLLDRGVSPNSSLDTLCEAWDGIAPSNTPILFLAAMIPSSADLVELLLEKGADQHMPYTRHRTKFYETEKTLCGFERAYATNLIANVVAVRINAGEQSPDPDTFRKIKLLIQYGGNINAEIHELLDHTVLQFSLKSNPRRCENALSIMPSLIALGADVTRVDSEGSGMIHLLCGHFIKEIQEIRPALSTKLVYMFKPSPLPSLIDLFVDAGADPNAKDALGRTSLMLLCRQAHNITAASLINVLVRDREIDFKATDKQGCNILHYATGEPADPFHHEPCFRLQVVLSRAAEKAALGVDDVNAYNNSGRTPFHVLLEASHNLWPRILHDRICWRVYNKVRALTMLIRAGADVRARTRSSFASLGGDTPLHLALWNQSLDYQFGILPLTRLLLRHGAAADINYVSPSQYMTPLMVVVTAAARNNLPRFVAEPLIHLLLTAGADAQQRDSRGRTAWDIFFEIRGPPLSISPWSLCLKEIMPQGDDDAKAELENTLRR